MPEDDSAKGSRSVRALEVLEAVIALDRPAAPADVAQQTGLPKATVHRLLAVLMRDGFLVLDPNGRGYVGGHRLTDLAQSVIAASGARVARHRVLADVAAAVGETCNITVPGPGYMTYFDRVESEWPVRVQLPAGSQVPLHCTASGKLYLSSLDDSELDRLLASTDLERRTARTITDKAALKEALQAIRAEGVGVDDEEFLDGMVAVAVPVTDARGRLSATLAVHGPTVRMSLADARSHIPRLRRAAAELSARNEDAG